MLLPRLVPRSFERVTEERVKRLLFVAMTRALKWLYFSTNSGHELPALEPLQTLAGSKITVQTSSDRLDTARLADPLPGPGLGPIDLI